MPLFQYKCSECEEISSLLHNEELKCESCESGDIVKILSVPSKTLNTNRGDKYHNKHAPDNIREILAKRSKDHSIKTLSDTIDQFGEQAAKEQGWIDKNGKIKQQLDDK